MSYSLRSENDVRPLATRKGTLFAALYFLAIVVAMGVWLYVLFQLLISSIEWLFS